MPAKHQELIVSPDSFRFLTFSQPLWEPAKDDEFVPWTQLSLVDRQTGESFEVEEIEDVADKADAPDFHDDDADSEEEGPNPGPLHEAFYAPRSDPRLWSPDGRYLLVVRLTNVGPADSEQALMRQSYDFLDTYTGAWASFTAGKTLASADSFQGWVADKPHTMLLVNDWGHLVEALPDEETSPE